MLLINTNNKMNLTNVLFIMLSVSTMSVSCFFNVWCPMLQNLSLRDLEETHEMEDFPFVADSKKINIFPVNTFTRKFDHLEEIDGFEPHIVDKNTPCLLLITGLNGLITHDIYSNVLHSIASRNTSVYIPKHNYKNLDKLVNELNKIYNEVIPVGHSSGATVILKTFAKNKKIKKMILIDPVDSRIFSKYEKFDLRHLSSILFIHAGKTYEANPISFIPDIFKITTDNFILSENCHVKKVESAEHGHCDILNKFYADTISKNIKIIGSSPNRNSLHEYYKWISYQVTKFITSHHHHHHHH